MRSSIVRWDKFQLIEWNIDVQQIDVWGVTWIASSFPLQSDKLRDMFQLRITRVLWPSQKRQFIKWIQIQIYCWKLQGKLFIFHCFNMQKYRFRSEIVSLEFSAELTNWWTLRFFRSFDTKLRTENGHQFQKKSALRGHYKLVLVGPLFRFTQ